MVMDGLRDKCTCRRQQGVDCLSENCPYELLDTFNSIFHDLKTPLNIILSSLQILELYEASGKLYQDNTIIKKYFKVLKQNSYRLIRLVNNVLDVTKIEADLFNIHLVNLEIVSLIKNITSSVKDYASTKGIEVHFCSNVSEKLLAFDPDKMERIMLNLLSNSIKFTHYGGRIRIKINDLGSKVQIIVQDNGVGMTKKEVDEAFNKFKQLKKNYKENEGTGLGLSLVKRLVEMHGGSIWIESKKGKGTKFFIEIPVRLVENSCEGCNDVNALVEKINIEFSDIYEAL